MTQMAEFDLHIIWIKCCQKKNKRKCKITKSRLKKCVSKSNNLAPSEHTLAAPQNEWFCCRNTHTPVLNVI